MTDSTRLDSQVAIVTGAARGIGQGIVLVLAEAGARVVLGDVLDPDTTVREVRAGGGEAIGMVMDISKPVDDRALVDLAIREYGRLDILVNNAAMDDFNWSRHGPISAWDLSDDLWKKVIDVNLSGTFYCSKAALKPMMVAGRGCIINISSLAAVLGSPKIPPAYNASKAGMLGLTMALSTQLADKGIRVNAVVPDVVESQDPGWSPETRAQKELQNPLGMMKSRDVGEAVLYLASPAAEKVSGIALQLSGGYQRGAVIV